LEVLIACMILSCTLMGWLSLQTTLWYQADVSNQRTMAIYLAQQQLENIRSNPLVEPAQTLEFERAATQYTLTHDVVDVGALKHVKVVVHWVDRHGLTQEVWVGSEVSILNFDYALALNRPFEWNSPIGKIIE
jgi:Tfp pilus assembly protein PilV